jgi:micrococcal nuclease
MFELILLSVIVMMFFVPLLSSDSFAHQSGCHRWHSCPSDDGSYVCGDTGHDSQCGNSDSKKNSDDDNTQKKDSNNEKESSALPKSTITEGIELSGRVTKVVDGDTLDVNNVRVRLALVNTPERGQEGYQSAKNFLTDLCLGKQAQVDMDDGQRGGDRYGREIGIVYCNGVNVNSELMDKDLAVIYKDYCDISEFANENWVDC